MTGLPSDKWIARHDSVVAWAITWQRLVLVFAPFVFYAIFTNRTTLAFWFIAAQWIFLCLQVLCINRHAQLHKEIGD